MSNYGLQLRIQPSQQKKQPARPPRSTPRVFQDDDEGDVEGEISRHANKNKALKDIEDQHKKALEEDPLAFDYDGVYDEMKQKVARPLVQDQQERKPRYIQALIEKAKERERDHEIVYERKLVNERKKEDHLYEGKEKFVTRGYKKKLAEREKWLEEERLRQLREEKEDITKKGDMSEFYFNLSKNVAFGSREAKLREQQQQKAEVGARTPEERVTSTSTNRASSTAREEHQVRSSIPHKEGSSDAKCILQENVETEPVSDQPKSDHHRRGEDAIAAAKERFLARKRVKAVDTT